ncbi:replication protein [Citrobacter freundii]|uniref:replication protein n=1 Tax=Citrobacter freundii TaxID=546 RepID=UPI0015E4FC73|nr:replication protein [Citrobacter freundii]EJD6096202.1 replication protein [Citrobacter freundii]MBJ9063422.1 replication protein [Citrobacter freundii]MBQ5151513.1 DNA replication protein [Citrobacter freundii]MDT7411590.1 replication protein [Citrobacter freundii]QLN74504.1 replication protein [Citrobacter freundii]
MGVVKLADYRPPLEVVEHRVAQLEDGFTRVANELLDAVMASGLSETELCVVLAVWRKTYGYNKKMDWVSNDQLEQMIAKHHTHCSTAKNQLVAKKVLVQEGRSVGMNTSIIEWKTKINGFCKTLAKPAKDSLAEVANKTLAESAKETLAEGAKDDGETLAESAFETKQDLLTTKDNIQKTINNTPQPPEGECVGQEEKSVSKKTQIDYQAVLSAYNTTLGDRLPQAEALNDKRRRAIKRLLTELKEPTVEAVENYFAAFAERAPKFYFGENDRGWRASFDYLLRSDTLLKTREKAL